MKKVRMRLTMKPGVSLHFTTPLPSFTSQNFDDFFGRFRIRILAGNIFQQAQITRRVEEVRDQEMFLEILIRFFHQHFERNGRGVG
jgi:hypothetical protein